jgi:hypothetical protein
MPTVDTIKALQSAAAGNRNLTIRTIPRRVSFDDGAPGSGWRPLRRVVGADYTAALVQRVVSQAR